MIPTPVDLGELDECEQSATVIPMRTMAPFRYCSVDADMLKAALAELRQLRTVVAHQEAVLGKYREMVEDLECDVSTLR